MIHGFPTLSANHDRQLFSELNIPLPPLNESTHVQACSLPQELLLCCWTQLHRSWVATGGKTRLTGVALVVGCTLAALLATKLTEATEILLKRSLTGNPAFDL
jgi:hypothetical protein